jgi:hypothetical protein
LLDSEQQSRRQGLVMTVDDESRDQVKLLTDRAEIYDCMQRDARGIDRQDRALLRSAYHDGAVDDHLGFVGVVDDFIDSALAYHSTQTIPALSAQPHRRHRR